MVTVKVLKRNLKQNRFLSMHRIGHLVQKLTFFTIMRVFYKH